MMRGAAIFRILFGLVFIGQYFFGGRWGGGNPYFVIMGLIFIGFGIYTAVRGKKAEEKALNNLATKLNEKMQQNQTDKSPQA